MPAGFTDKATARLVLSTFWWSDESGPSRSLFASTVIRNLTIDDNRHELVAFYVLELHNLMSAPSKLPPAAGFLRVLFDRPVFVTFDAECNHLQALATSSPDRYRLPRDAH